MPIISIAFYMVLIRIAMRRNSKNVPVSTTRNTSRTHATDSESQGTTYGMRPLQVYISQFSGDESTVSPYRDGNQGRDTGHHFSMDKGESDVASY